VLSKSIQPSPRWSHHHSKLLSSSRVQPSEAVKRLPDNGLWGCKPACKLLWKLNDPADVSCCKQDRLQVCILSIAVHMNIESRTLDRSAEL
jgi:hypothetical protein